MNTKPVSFETVPTSDVPFVPFGPPPSRVSRYAHLINAIRDLQDGSTLIVDCGSEYKNPRNGIRAACAYLMKRDVSGYGFRTTVDGKVAITKAPKTNNPEES